MLAALSARVANSNLRLVQSLSLRYQEGCRGSVRYEDLGAEALLTIKRIYSLLEVLVGAEILDRGR